MSIRSGQKIITLPYFGIGDLGSDPGNYRCPQRNKCDTSPGELPSN
jgi:hypothetical protein